MPLVDQPLFWWAGNELFTAEAPRKGHVGYSAAFAREYPRGIFVSGYENTAMVRTILIQ